MFQCPTQGAVYQLHRALLLFRGVPLKGARRCGVFMLAASYAVLLYLTLVFQIPFGMAPMQITFCEFDSGMSLDLFIPAPLEILLKANLSIPDAVLTASPVRNVFFGSPPCNTISTAARG